MQSEPEINVKWSETPVDTMEDAITETLRFIDEQQEQGGWDQAPTLGVVHMSSAGHVGSFSVTMPRMSPDFFNSFEQGMATLAATCLTAEIMGHEDEQQFLNGGVGQGFEGWLISAEFFSTELTETGEEKPGQVEQRLTLMVDLNSTTHGVCRVRGEDHAEKIHGVVDLKLTRSLTLLVAASIMSIVRRNLDESE